MISQRQIVYIISALRYESTLSPSLMQMHALS